MAAEVPDAPIPPGAGHVVASSTDGKELSLHVDDASSNEPPKAESSNANGVDPSMDASEEPDDAHIQRPAPRATGPTPIQHQENARRNVSGGFLLQPLQPAFKKTRPKKESKSSSAPHRLSKPAQLPIAHAGQMPHGITPESGHDGAVDAALMPTNGNTTDNIHIEKRRKAKGKGRESTSPPASRASSTAAGSSSSARPQADYAHLQETHLQDADGTHQPVVDSAAIVRMALSLNESRRLNLSPGRLASSPSPVGRRSTSARVPLPSTPLTGHFADHREELGRSLQSAAAPRRSSPSLYATGSQNSRPGSASRAALEPSGLFDFDKSSDYSFSASTIARAEKARQFLELHHEYRRLLEVLPPLVPSSEPHSSRGHDAGRPYNPLQYIRNRKIRGRERALLDPEGAGWNQTDDVKAWVDSTLSESKLPGFKDGDIAMLPPWNRHGRNLNQDPGASLPGGDTSGNAPSASKPKRPKLDWTFSPFDLLADAYWLEQDAHKTLIERSDGSKIFNRIQRPEPLGPPEATRRSYESKEDDRENDYSSPFPELNRSPSSPPDQRDSFDNIAPYSSNTLSQTSGSNISRVRRRLLPRRRTASTNASLSSGTDEGADAPRQGKTSLGRKLGVNIGPLEKHIESILRLESQRNSVHDNAEPDIPKHEDGQRRRGGVSSEYQKQAESPDAADKRDSRSHEIRSMRSSFSTEPPYTPRISIDDPDGIRTLVNGYAPSPVESITRDGQGRKRTQTRSRVHRPLHLFHRRGKSKQQNSIDETDFAAQAREPADEVPPKSSPSPRSSLDSSPQWSSRRPSIGEALSRHQSNSKSHENIASATSSTTRFFKGGRIGEIVRSERPGFAWKKEAPRKDSVASSQQGTAAIESDSDKEDGIYLRAKSNDPRRSQSATDLSPGSPYSVPNLPTFRSAKAPPSPVDRLKPANPREQQIKDSGTKSRYDRHSRSSFSTSPDLSPNTSTNDLTRLATAADSVRTGRSDVHDASRSSSGVREADVRLNKILREPGGVGKGGLPMTGLSKFDARPSRSSRLSESHRAWSQSDGLGTSEGTENNAVTIRDVNHVRSLLLSSGVKAQAIVRRANTVRDPPSAYLVRAAKTANATFTPVSRRSEHILAARILSNNLESVSSSFQTAAEQFRNDTCNRLQASIDDLHERVNSDLAPHVSSCGDEADAFIARLTTSHTLAVKQVNDSVDLMLRSRWKRLRFLRRTGFKILEWVLVALMWWIWLFVFMFKAARGLVVGIVTGVRWLLWI